MTEIRVLTENTAKDSRFLAQHGLSLYIKVAGTSILFDMGQTDLFVKNAETLGVSLGDVDIAVLSHGHYDHGGGLRTFLEINKKAPVYIREDAFMPHFNGTEKYIGLDTELCDNSRIVFTHSVVSICKGITLYPAANNITGKFSSAGLTFFENGEYHPEDFRHEQYLEICENGKRILFSGCSHRGITNIVSQFRPDILIGGFHLSKITDESILTEYAQYLDSFDTDYFTCHCTGNNQLEFLCRYMKRLHPIMCGDTLEF